MALLSREINRLPDQQITANTERATLKALYGDFLEMSASVDSRSALRISKIKNTINYVGQSEMMEAAEGIAEYWKWRLRRDLDKKLFLPLGRMDDDSDYAAPKGRVKSDEFLADIIFSNFTDDELKEFSGRIITEEGQLGNNDNVDVIMLDDWIVTGTEMSDRVDNFLVQNPDLASRIEIQLVIADESRLKLGFRSHGRGDSLPYVPTRAYYLANGDGQSWNAYMTGFHSSDYTLAGDLAAISQRCGLGRLPVGLQVVRPYHSDHYRPTFLERMKKV